MGNAPVTGVLTLVGELLAHPAVLTDVGVTGAVKRAVLAVLAEGEVAGVPREQEGDAAGEGNGVVLVSAPPLRRVSEKGAAFDTLGVLHALGVSIFAQLSAIGVTSTNSIVCTY